jgi:hypothetical protein
METLDRARTLGRLAQAIVWNRREKPLAITPDGRHVQKVDSRLVVDEAYAADETPRAVEEIVSRRATLLSASDATPLVDDDTCAGRILLLLADRNLKDGAAHLASGHFFSELNIPPCDLWVDYLPAVELIEGGVEGLWSPGYRSRSLPSPRGEWTSILKSASCGLSSARYSDVNLASRGGATAAVHKTCIREPRSDDF